MLNINKKSCKIRRLRRAQDLLAVTKKCEVRKLQHKVVVECRTFHTVAPWLQSQKYSWNMVGGNTKDHRGTETHTETHANTCTRTLIENRAIMLNEKVFFCREEVHTKRYDTDVTGHTDALRTDDHH